MGGQCSHDSKTALQHPLYSGKGPSVRKVVFIVGAGHSGSTLLELILGCYSEAFAIGEFWSISRKVDDAKSGLTICGICSGNYEFWDGKA